MTHFQRLRIDIYRRLFEWVVTLILLGIGITMVLPPPIYQQGLLKVFGSVGISEFAMGLVFIFIGVLRLVALVVNGASTDYGPRVRAIVAAVTAVIWAQLATSLFIDALTGDRISLQLPLYLGLMVGEFIAAFRAVQDVGRTD
jgi:hypothetical protein